MANNIGHTIWYLDTTGMIKETSVKIQALGWGGYSLATDQLVIKTESGGDVLFKAIAGVNTGELKWFVFPKGAVFPSFYLDTISGYLLVVLE